MNLQTRLELELSAQQWADSIMSNFNISAADMENALTKVILNLKQKVLQDYLIEQQQNYQEFKNTSNLVQEKEAEEIDSI